MTTGRPMPSAYITKPAPSCHVYKSSSAARRVRVNGALVARTVMVKVKNGSSSLAKELESRRLHFYRSAGSALCRRQIPAWLAGSRVSHMYAFTIAVKRVALLWNIERCIARWPRLHCLRPYCLLYFVLLTAFIYRLRHTFWDRDILCCDYWRRYTRHHL